MSAPKRSPVMGPFEVIGEQVGDGRKLVSIPFADVAGAQIIATVTDNFGTIVPASRLAQYWAGADVSLWGVIQSYRTVIKRQFIRMGTGPMKYTFPFEEAYSEIHVHAVNASGGTLGPSNNGGTLPSAANGFSIKVNLYLAPRSGFGMGGKS